MLILYAFILAIVQAITEFWPISSSGHLLVLHEFLNFEIANSFTFDIALHLGTLLALVLYFWHDIVRYFKTFLSMFHSFNLANEEQKTVLNIVIATIPAVIIGFLASDFIEMYARNLLIVAIALILGGLVLWGVEHWGQKKRNYESLSIPEALIVGLAQTLAFVPGVSRSGATIIAGMWLKLKRAEAARFSFLLSIPAVLGAALSQLVKFSWAGISFEEKYIFIFAILVSFFGGYLVIKYFLKFLEKRPLYIFAYYRIIFGLLILAVLYFK